MQEAPSERQNKVARQIQKDLSELFIKFAKDWFPGVILSVQTVRVSPDFSLAKCYISIFPSGNKEEILKRVGDMNKEIRYQLGKRIKNQMRKVPELAFYLDDSIDYIEKIDGLLED